MVEEAHEIFNFSNDYFIQESDATCSSLSSLTSLSTVTNKKDKEKKKDKECSSYNYQYHEKLWFMQDNNHANNIKYKINYLFWNGEYEEAYNYSLKLLSTESNPDKKKMQKRENVDIAIQCALKMNKIQEAVKLLDMIDSCLDDPSIYWLKYIVYEKAGLEEQANDALDKFSSSRYNASTGTTANFS